jgi:hypothetical protein
VRHARVVIVWETFGSAKDGVIHHRQCGQRSPWLRLVASDVNRLWETLMSVHALC